jgi:hypothetical protein
MPNSAVVAALPLWTLDVAFTRLAGTPLHGAARAHGDSDDDQQDARPP